MTIAYLCGPVSNGGTLQPARVKENIAKFKAVAIKFGPTITVLDPTSIDRQKCWEDYMKQAIPMVCQAHIVVLLPGWENSRGAVLEVLIANSLNIPIVFADHLLDK